MNGKHIYVQKAYDALAEEYVPYSQTQLIKGEGTKMISMKEMADLDTIATRVENCIAQQEAQQVQLADLVVENQDRIVTLRGLQKSIRGFLNSATLMNAEEERTVKTPGAIL